MITIAERLRQLREEKSLSQEQFAVAMGVTRMTVAGYELSKRVPDTDFLLRAGEFFNCTPNYLLGLTDFRNDEHYKEWVGSIDTLAAGLSILTTGKRKELVTALNWVLQDNYGVNSITSDKDYLIDKLIGVIIPFTHLFQGFIKALENSNPEMGVTPADIFTYIKSTEIDKDNLQNTVNLVTHDLVSFLFAKSKKEEFPKAAHQSE